jgi:environmental stress-induced protein Ves
MADVPASGPFSRFPGVDRSLVLLSGRMELDHGEHGRQALDGPFRPVTFSGDWPTSGRLLDGPCRDFNVMSARGRVTHRLGVLTAPVVLPAAPRLVVVCLDGHVEIAGQTLGPWELLDLEGGAQARGSGRLAVVELSTSS